MNGLRDGHVITQIWQNIIESNEYMGARYTYSLIFYYKALLTYKVVERSLL